MVSEQTKQLLVRVVIIITGLTVLGAILAYFMSKILLPGNISGAEASAINTRNAFKGALFGLASSIVIILYMAYTGSKSVTV
jgi:hypothetical protein